MPSLASNPKTPYYNNYKKASLTRKNSTIPRTTRAFIIPCAQRIRVKPRAIIKNRAALYIIRRAWTGVSARDAGVTATAVASAFRGRDADAIRIAAVRAGAIDAGLSESRESEEGQVVEELHGC